MSKNLYPRAKAPGLYAQPCNDRLTGGRGKDVLRGGADADIFVINSFRGADKILDYKDGTDKFSLDGVRFGSLSFTQRNNNVLISQGNKVLVELI
ncbi:hypothetical protein [Leptolyngbya sp. 7M]|uniref:hypothetical protein n=1 Tax=Leptolyngbya sp. 7M TaxID=2812896 RepID=UPI001B8C5DDD|nr:hypothetical protein [Leptolyngbya sp. 7M]QYO67522.1 hypothetical protein JVX88_12435 [Leptolyngbya sp. 7M]